MRTVARRVGVSATAIYRHFDDKDVLLRDLAAEGFERLASYGEAALAEPTAEKRLWRFMERFLDFAIDEPDCFALMFFVSGRHVRRFPEDFAAQRSVTAKMLTEHVKECMREGVLRADDPLETMLTIWAQAHGLIALQRTGRFGDVAIFRTIYVRSMERLLDGLRAPPSDVDRDGSGRPTRNRSELERS